VISQLHAVSEGETEVITSLTKMYTCKTYDHFCRVHLIPMIAREGNIVKYATFSTEHDNFLIRQDLRAHTSAGGGQYGEVTLSDVKQLFDRRTVMRCDAVLCAALHQTGRDRKGSRAGVHAKTIRSFTSPRSIAGATTFCRH
jgi:hypothetical protein